MWSACRDAGVGHFVPFWTRYVEVFRQARQIVRDGRLGEIRVVIYRWHNPRPSRMPFTWRDDATVSAAGSVADVGSHAYDTLRWMLGIEAQRVVAHAQVVSPPKPDLGPINLEEALRCGQAHGGEASAPLRHATTSDYASIAFELESGAVGTILLSHAHVLRKGLAPELELHGTEASLSVDRAAGELRLVRPERPPEPAGTCPEAGFGNRFQRYVWPAIRQRAAGLPCEHPGLEDGWRVQRFTDAAVLSARSGGWVELHEADKPPPRAPDP
jgi:predicted dehydrogenase